MIYAHIYDYMIHAEGAFRKFIDDNDKIVKIRRAGTQLIAYLQNGDEHHFMSASVFQRWRLGRTYMIGDTLCHSGMPVKRGDNDVKLDG